VAVLRRILPSQCEPVYYPTQSDCMPLSQLEGAACLVTNHKQSLSIRHPLMPNSPCSLSLQPPCSHSDLPPGFALTLSFLPLAPPSSESILLALLRGGAQAAAYPVVVVARLQGQHHTGTRLVHLYTFLAAMAMGCRMVQPMKHGGLLDHANSLLG
jgi:hypothetical protein